MAICSRICDSAIAIGELLSSLIVELVGSLIGSTNLIEILMSLASELMSLIVIDSHRSDAVW